MCRRQIRAQSILGPPPTSMSSPTTSSLSVTSTSPSDNGGAAITAAAQSWRNHRSGAPIILSAFDTFQTRASC